MRVPLLFDKPPTNQAGGRQFPLSQANMTLQSVMLFPRTHLIALAIVGLCLCPFVVARFVNQSAAIEVKPNLETPTASINKIHSTAIRETATVPRALSHTEENLVESDSVSLTAGSKTEILRIQSGDSLATLFKRKGIPSADLHRLINSQPFGQRLKSIYPGHQLSITKNQDNSLVNLTYSPGPLKKLVFSRVGGTFEGIEDIAEPERIIEYRHGKIDHSLFVASQRAGLDDAETMRLAKIFQWDIDFVLDIRAGDTFHVLLEELHLGDQFVGYGNILAAEFVNQGESYRAVRYTDTNGRSNYFSPDGKSMRKAFLRAPVSFTRISSNFNLKRKHPLWNKAMPHRGIDYAAPIGTSILAPGDGTVVTAGQTKANGNYLVIRHANDIVTKYLHLSRFARGIGVNTSVRQGQTIGYVGNTGWSTGPHLHYEFLVNGVHKNPRTVLLPNAEPIPTNEMERFIETAAPLFATLDGRKQVPLALVSR